MVFKRFHKTNMTIHRGKSTNCPEEMQIIDEYYKSSTQM